MPLPAAFAPPRDDDFRLVAFDVAGGAGGLFDGGLDEPDEEEETDDASESYADHCAGGRTCVEAFVAGGEGEVEFAGIELGRRG